MTFKYRRAKNKDLKSIAWLVTCNIGTCDLKPEIDVHVNDEAIFQRNLNTIDVSKYYVCEKNCEIIGLCGIDKSSREDCDEILYLVVASSYRKLGIGTKLLELCCNSTDKDVLYEAWGDGSEVNSKHILEKLGFKLIENKGDEFYKDNGYCNLCVNRNKTNCNSCKCEIWKLNHNQRVILTGWVARDKNGALSVHDGFPIRDEDYECWQSLSNLSLKEELFPELKWEDTPIEVEISIKQIKQI